jgi:hypothetical protein
MQGIFWACVVVINNPPLPLYATASLTRILSRTSLLEENRVNIIYRPVSRSPLFGNGVMHLPSTSGTSPGISLLTPVDLETWLDQLAGLEGQQSVQHIGPHHRSDCSRLSRTKSPQAQVPSPCLRPLALSGTVDSFLVVLSATHALRIMRPSSKLSPASHFAWLASIRVPTAFQDLKS